MLIVIDNRLSISLSVLFTEPYGNRGCRVFKQGVKKWKEFCPKIHIPKGSYGILRMGVMGRCQLENNVIKNCAPKLVLFNEKKNCERFS